MTDAVPRSRRLVEAWPLEHEATGHTSGHVRDEIVDSTTAMVLGTRPRRLYRSFAGAYTVVIMTGGRAPRERLDLAQEELFPGIGLAEIPLRIPYSTLNDLQTVTWNPLPLLPGARTHVAKADDMKVWREYLGPLFSLHDAADRFTEGDESRLHEYASRGELLILEGPTEERLVPEFLFSPDTKLPLTGLAPAINEFRGAVATPYTIAAWLRTPQLHLENQTPFQWLSAGKEPDAVREAARRVVIHLAH